MTKLSQKATKKRLRELCVAHLELERIRKERSDISGSGIIDQMQADNLAELEREILKLAKALFGQPYAAKKTD